MGTDPDAGPMPFRRVAVLGLGLMGGSLVRGLSLLERPPERTGWSPDPAEGRAASADGALDRVAGNSREAAAGADLVVLAAPPEASAGLVPTVLDAMRPDAVLTDLASLKGPMQAAAEAAGAGGRWVGSHPMCGSERSGYAASRPDLYRGARVWLVAPGGAEEPAARMDAFWRALGARPATIEAGAHDALMGLVSHLPQLTANALASVLEEAGVSPDDLGPGGRDMTRLASSSPWLWRDILMWSHTTLPGALRALARRADELADLVDAGDLDAVTGWMEANREWREGS